MNIKNEVVNVLWESALSFLVLFIISKILGKKQVAQLEFSDYVIGITIGSIAAQMAFDNEFPFYSYLISMAMFGGLNFLLDIISRKGKFLKKILKGQPLVLIQNGKLNYNNLKKSKIDVNELLSASRIAGYFNINEIAYCYFETSGDFSFLPKTNFANTQKQDFNQIKKISASDTNYVIIDGHYIFDKLHNENKTVEWLNKKLNINSKKDLKNIILALIDGENVVAYKKDSITNAK